MSATRACCIQLPDFQRSLHELRDPPQALLGSEPQHLADLGSIDAVLVDLGPTWLGARVSGRLGHAGSLHRGAGGAPDDE